MDNKSSSSGMGLLGCLQIIFIVLKLTGLINWTWVQVFIPFFIELGIIAIVVFVVVCVKCIYKK